MFDLYGLEIEINYFIFSRDARLLKKQMKRNEMIGMACITLHRAHQVYSRIARVDRNANRMKWTNSYERTNER